MKFFRVFITVWAATLISSALSQAQLAEQDQKGKLDQALAKLRTAVTVSPRNAEAWQRLGQLYLRASKPDSAEFAGQQIVSIDKKNAQGYILIAQAQMAQKKLLEAKETLKKGLRTLRNNGPLLTQLGYVLLASDSTDRAVIAFSQAKEVDPQNALTYEGLGDAYQKMGTTAIAIMQYEKSLSLDSLNVDLNYKIARLYVKDKRYNDAVRFYRNVVLADSTNEGALLELGKIYFAAKQYTNAARVYQTYAQRSSSPTRWALLMEALYLGRHYQDALAAAKRAQLTDPNSKLALKIIAHSNYEVKNYQESVDSYTRLASVDTLSLDDVKRFGKAYAEIKQDSLAAHMLEQVLRKDPSQNELYGDLGAIYMRMRHYDRAAEMFKKRYTLDPSSTSAYINFALCNMALGKWDSSRVALRQAIILKPQYMQGHLFLARCLIQLDSLQQAKKEYETIISLTDTIQAKYQGELAEAHRMIGFVYLLDKKYPPAIESLTRSRQLKNDDAQTHLWLAQSYALMNRREEALKEYQIVLKLDPKNETAKKDIEKLGLKN